MSSDKNSSLLHLFAIFRKALSNAKTEFDFYHKVGFYKSIGFEKASDLVQREIAESFNEECDLYMVSLDEV